MKLIHSFIFHGVLFYFLMKLMILQTSSSILTPVLRLFSLLLGAGFGGTALGSGVLDTDISGAAFCVPSSEPDLLFSLAESSFLMY